MWRGMVTVLMGMLLQAGLARVTALWPSAAPAASTGTVAQPAAAEATPPAPEPELSVSGPFGLAFGGCGPLLPLDREALLQAAAEALNLTPEALEGKLATGQTLGEVADEQGVDRATVATALQQAALAAYQAQLDAAVAAGHLTQPQADARLAVLAAEDFTALLDRPLGLFGPLFDALPFGGDLPPFFGPGGPDGGGVELGRGGYGLHFSWRGDDGHTFTFEWNSDTPAFRAAAAEALSLSADEVAARLEAGDPLEAIADEQNVPLADVQAALRTAMLAEAKAQLDAAVAAGTLTQSQAGAIYTQLDQMGTREPVFGPGGLPRFFEDRLPFPFATEAPEANDVQY